MTRHGEVEYESLRVQPGKYTVGELEWKYDFDIEIEVSTKFLRSYVVFVSMVLDGSTLDLDRITEFKNQFDQKLIDADVQYAFEDADETYSVKMSFELVQDAIQQFRNVSEDQFLLKMGEDFIDRLAEQYEQEVGLKPEEDIPGPIVPSQYQAVCPECQNPLNVLRSEKRNEMYCAGCDSVRNQPNEWEWRTPEPAPEYTGTSPEEQPAPREAACPNCGSRLSFYQEDIIGHCSECRGIWRQGTWHRFDLIDPAEAACPDCGSKLSGTESGGHAVCESCASTVRQRDWQRYDPDFENQEFPVEVESGVLQVSEQKYKVKSTGHMVDSLWEADIDRRLAKRVPEHEREPGPYKISAGYYIPDFRVNDVVVEVKGIQHESMLKSAVSKAKEFKKRNPELTYVVIGDEASEEIPSDKWFNYPSDASDCVQWIVQQ